MSEPTKWITITVPVTERPSGCAGQAGAWTEYDGRKGLWVAHDDRERLVWSADVQKAMLAAWLSEPTTDYAKRLAEIETVVRAWEWHCADEPDPAEDPGIGAHTALRNLEGMATTTIGWLLAQLRAVETALTAAGLPDDGRAPAERLGEAQRKMVDEIDRLALENEELRVALRAAKVLAEDGAPGESAADILRAAGSTASPSSTTAGARRRARCV